MGSRTRERTQKCSHRSVHPTALLSARLRERKKMDVECLNIGKNEDGFLDVIFHAQLVGGRLGAARQEYDYT